MRLLLVSGHRRFDKYKNLLRRLARGLAKALRQENSYCEVYLVGKEFMNKNVLAFPAPKNFPHPNTKLKPLGEIYLNPDFIAKDSPYPNMMVTKLRTKDYGLWTPSSELRAKLSYLFIHGLLHLLGYDHKKESDRIRMEKQERNLLKKSLGR